MKKTFGKIPIYKGDWSAGVSVKEKFRFTYMGSEFQALRDGLITPPVDGYYQLNDGWICISNGTDAYLAAEKIATNKTAIENVKNDLEAEISRAMEAESGLQTNITNSIASEQAAREVAINAEKSSRENADSVHDSRILEIEKEIWPLEVTLSLSSSLLEYTGEDQSVNATYSVKHKGALKKPNTLKLTKDRTDLGVAVVESNTTPITINKLGDTSIVLTASAHSYYGYHSEETSDIISGSVTKKVQMVLPIYAGFGTSSTDVVTEANKLSVRTSAAGTYSKTAAADGVNFFILVPATFTRLTSFTMGGAPFVMETSEITAGEFNKEYVQYKSGAVYNTGATVNIKAS